jgi:hypothetical protein
MCVFFDPVFTDVFADIRLRLGDAFFRTEVGCSRAFLDFKLMSPFATVSRAINTEPSPAGPAPRPRATAAYWRSVLMDAFAAVRLPDLVRDAPEIRRFPQTAMAFRYGAAAVSPQGHVADPTLPIARSKRAIKREAKDKRTAAATTAATAAAAAAAAAAANNNNPVGAQGRGGAAPHRAAPPMVSAPPAVVPAPRACGFHVINMLRPDLVTRACTQGTDCPRTHPTRAQLTKAIALDAAGILKDVTEREAYKLEVNAGNLPPGL